MAMEMGKTQRESQIKSQRLYFLVIAIVIINGECQNDKRSKLAADGLISPA